LPSFASAGFRRFHDAAISHFACRRFSFSPMPLFFSRLPISYISPPFLSSLIFAAAMLLSPPRRYRLTPRWPLFADFDFLHAISMPLSFFISAIFIYAFFISPTPARLRFRLSG
jgi:hypothetical protein